jgi:hypothetical protein
MDQKKMLALFRLICIVAALALEPFGTIVIGICWYGCNYYHHPETNTSEHSHVQ